MNMKEIGRFIKRALSRFTVGIVLTLMLNLFLFMGLFYSQISHYYKESHPREVLKSIADNLKYADSAYQLPTAQSELLSEKNLWAMLLSPKGSVIWKQNLPQNIPASYSLNDIAMLSHGYLQDYPVFVWQYNKDHLLIIGYPKSTFMKFSNNFAPITMIQRIPIYLFLLIIMNILLLFSVYTFSYTKTQKKLVPLIDGITKLSNGEYIRIPIAEDFMELSKCLNRTSDILEQKELAKRTWINGISHDIRTPLSMILGYSDRLVSYTNNEDQLQKQALIIRNQSIRIKELIEDLNLFTNLEYNMQPQRSTQIYFKKLIRNIVIDFLNIIPTDKYDIILQCMIPDNICIRGDEHLISRAIRNLIQNSINHNPDGCTINVLINLEESANRISLTIQDNGIGISQEKLQSLLDRKKYQFNDHNLTESPHGLGLTLVQLIVETHDGEMYISSDGKNGVCSIIKFPINNS